VRADTTAYFGQADFLAQLLEIKILLRNERLSVFSCPEPVSRPIH
jgi:hypothetical protein